MIKNGVRFKFVLWIIPFFLSSCTSIGYLETAETTPKGKVEAVSALRGHYISENSDNQLLSSERPSLIPAISLGYKFGLSNRMDIGTHFDPLGNFSLRFKFRLKDTLQKTRIAFGPTFNSSIFLLANNFYMQPSLVLYTSSETDDITFFTNSYITMFMFSPEGEPLQVRLGGFGANLGFLSRPLKIRGAFRLGFQIGFLLSSEYNDFHFALGITRKLL